MSHSGHSSATSNPTVVVYRDELLAGSERFIVDQASSLTRWTPILAGTRLLGDRGDAAGIPIRVIEEYSKTPLAEWAFKIFRRIPRRWGEAIAEEKPLLIHSHFGPDGFWAIPLAARMNLPMIVTFHGYDVTVRTDSSLSFRGYGMVRRTIFERASVIIAVSDFLRDELVRIGCPAEKIRVHYIGIDPSEFEPIPDRDREPVVLFVGRLVEKKGCAELIRAMATLKNVHPDTRTVVIGDGPERENVEQLARDESVPVEFLGSQPPAVVKEWMNRARVFSVASHRAANGDSEALGLVFLEAQAMELPVASFHHGGIPEAVRNGETGYLVEEGDSEALADSISRLLGDSELRRRLGRLGRRHVIENFDRSASTRALESIYDEVVGVLPRL